MATFASNFVDLCSQTVVWQPLIGRDAYGKPTYNPVPQTFAGRRVYKNTRVRSYERGNKGQGAEVISESQIWILGNLAIQYEDSIYISGEDDPTKFLPPVLSVERYPDETGATVFTKVFLGSSNG